jgi:hypothetical protein
MEQCCGPLAVDMIPGKHCDFITYLAKRARAQSAHVQSCSFLINELSCGPLAVEIVPGKHCDFRTYLTKRSRAQSLACLEVQYPDYGRVLWSPGNRNISRKAGSTAISSPTLPRERELSLQHAQGCSSLINEQRCGPLAVEIILGKHCDFSTYITKRARAQSLACLEVKYPDYGTVLWSPGSRNDSRKTLQFQHLSCQRARAQSAHVQRCSFLIVEQCCGPLAVEMFPGKISDFSTYLAKTASAQSGAFAEVQFPDYGSVLWSPGSRNYSRKALQFQHLSYQECEN